MSNRLYVASEETAQAIKADTTGILKILQDADGKLSNIRRYGVKINRADSDPNNRVTYLYDAVGMNAARMNFTEGVFDYGDWGSIFFVKNNRPVMLNADKTVAYELNHSDHSLKIDGTASDVADASTTMNAMSEFPLIWLCQYEIGNYEYIIVSDTRVDSTYFADAYEREDGTIADHMYMPMYGGSYDGAKLRSLSGKVMDSNTSAQAEINRAAANGAGWTIIPWSRRNLLNSLLTIISKSDDSKGRFGQGNISGYVDDASKNYGKLNTGTLDNKGQFYGYNDGVHQVKAFYCEKLWGDRWDRLVGYICDHGRIKVKMTPPYNLTGAGYIDTGIDAPASNGYQKEAHMTRYGRFPKTIGGSATTYMCAYYWINLTIVAIALVGGVCYNGAHCAASFVNLSSSDSLAYWDVGASLSCEQPSAA